MPDYGLGALPDPPDPRDLAIDVHYAALGIAPTDALPASYVVPQPWAPVLDQGNSPECVAYGSKSLKTYEDMRDTGFVDLDQDRFFRYIGGTSAGAVPRDAFDWMLHYGYPEAGGANEGQHKIAAYYAVPLTQASLCAAIYDLGIIGLSFTWPYSWFSPVNGVLPHPNAAAGGHFLDGVGWDATKGLRLRNSWGTGYGVGGDVYMPWAYIGQMRGAFKAVDVIEVKPAPAGYTVHFAAYATVMKASGLSSTGTGCIKGWTMTRWGAKPSSAPANLYRPKAPGCNSGSAPVAHITSGVYAGAWLRIGTGLSITVNT